MMRYTAMGAVAAAVLFTTYVIFYAITAPVQQMSAQMPGGSMDQNPTPPVKGFYQGKEVLFIHTEASDPQVAGMLTRMMGPKVLTVPSLGKIPGHLLGGVYVFTNGVKGGGPFGFQADVFDSVPGDPGYTPLRAITLVTWQKGAAPGVLGSVAEIQTAASRSEVALRRPGVVVNMPMLVWPGGRR